MNHQAKKIKPIISETKKNSKLCIVGGGATKANTPATNPEFDIWTVGLAAPEHHKRSSLVFEMHSGALSRDFELWKKNPKGREKYFNDLQTCGCPVVMTEKFSKIPNSVPYPLEEITGMFGAYFNNTVSYMIALALYMDYDELFFFGVDMDEEQYTAQKPACEFYIGWAIGLGKQVFIPNESSLLKAEKLYGYDTCALGGDYA